MKKKTKKIIPKCKMSVSGKHLFKSIPGWMELPNKCDYCGLVNDLYLVYER